jgi:hypothetical protein
MSLSKKTRFEIFKRDGFTCQYCGQRPPEVVLEVDHIHPSSKGGSDDEINLITSCFDCNRGKSDKKIGDIHPRPDADIRYLETQQEIGEAKRYLTSQEQLAVVQKQIKERLKDLWTEYLTPTYAPSDKQFGAWLAWHSPEDLDFAIRRASGKYQSGSLQRGNEKYSCESCIRYVSGIMKSVAQEREANG